MSIVDNLPKVKWLVELGEKDKFAKVKVGTKVIDLKSLGYGLREFKKENAIAELIADAGKTANKSGKLPSELLEANQELLEATKELLALLRFHGYQHAKEITIAQELIQKHSTP